MRRAEVLTALILMLVAGGVAAKATQQPIGFAPEGGPAGGFFPFWLAVLTGLLAAVIALRAMANPGPKGVQFIQQGGWKTLLRMGLPTLLLVALINVISVYGAIILFLAYAVRHVGGHSRSVTLAVSLGVPVGVFILFEKFLVIPLPKGYAEPIFYLLY
ncbi:MAG: tripartite tricarboxylate transporter TctB family protein [Nitrospinota bacterium]